MAHEDLIMTPFKKAQKPMTRLYGAKLSVRPKEHTHGLPSMVGGAPVGPLAD